MILGKKLTCSQYLDCQFLLSLNILSFRTYDVTKFPTASKIISPLIHRGRNTDLLSNYFTKDCLIHRLRQIDLLNLIKRFTRCEVYNY